MHVGDDLFFPRPLLNQGSERHLAFAVALEENACVTLRAWADKYAGTHLGMCHALADG